MGVSSPGIGSGIDVNAIVSQLVAIERRPLVNLQSAAKEVQSQISSYGKLQGLLSTLRDRAAALAGNGLWQQTTASSSNTAVATVSAGGSAPAGVYSLEVSRLARAHSLASAAFADGATVVGAGRLTLQVGSGAPVTLEFTDAGTTLEQVRERINAAGTGVSASIVRDANGTRLTLTSRSSGAANTIAVSATDLGGAALATGLGQLAYPGGMTQTQAPANALATVNGLAIESASNKLDGVLSGLSITLTGTTTSPVSITAVDDSEGQRKAIQDFVDAYNGLNAFLLEQTKYDEASKQAGTLQGDSAAVGLRNRLRGLLREANGASPVFATLAAIGFDVKKDGSIALDKPKLDAALAQPAELAKLFASTDPAVPGNRGLGVRFRELADQLTGFDGTVTTRQQSLQDRLKRNQTEQDRLEDRIAQRQERLLQQYQALDARIGQLSSLSAYVSQQMSLLNKQSSND